VQRLQERVAQERRGLGLRGEQGIPVVGVDVGKVLHDFRAVVGAEARFAHEYWGGRGGQVVHGQMLVESTGNDAAAQDAGQHAPRAS
jgi:hypothetical protein